MEVTPDLVSARSPEDLTGSGQDDRPITTLTPSCMIAVVDLMLLSLGYGS